MKLRLQFSWLNTPSISDSLASVFSSHFAWSITQVKHTMTCKTETENKQEKKQENIGVELEYDEQKAKMAIFS